MKLNVSAKKEQIVFGDDNIVIQKYISGIKGGRTLDMTGYPLKVVKAGSVIITKDGAYAPMPIKAKMDSDGETVIRDDDGNIVYVYDTLTSGYSYAGVLYRSISADAPAASIMTNGEVNSEAIPYDMATILSSFKTACPNIVFIKDEEA